MLKYMHALVRPRLSFSVDVVVSEVWSIKFMFAAWFMYTTVLSLVESSICLVILITHTMPANCSSVGQHHVSALFNVCDKYRIG